jgi:hypothetical protein
LTQELCRALKGRLLPGEFYPEDDSSKARLSFLVLEYNYETQLRQGLDKHDHVISIAFSRESLMMSYERDLKDPRCQYPSVLEIYQWGDKLKT